MTQRVVLIRHGRSSHVHAGWIRREEFLRWRDAYEAAGIDNLPPDELRALVAGCACVIASTTRRGIESARALAPGRELVTSPLLVELELVPIHLRGVRLPLFGWALTFGVRWIKRAVLRQPQLSHAERERIDAAARWIDELADTHGSVAVVTHATFRRHLARALVARGWSKDDESGGWRHWSGWLLSRPAGSGHASCYGSPS